MTNEQEKKEECKMKPWCARNIIKRGLSNDSIYDTCTCFSKKEAEIEVENW